MITSLCAVSVFDGPRSSSQLSWRAWIWLGLSTLHFVEQSRKPEWEFLAERCCLFKRPGWGVPVHRTMNPWQENGSVSTAGLEGPPDRAKECWGCWKPHLSSSIRILSKTAWLVVNNAHIITPAVMLCAGELSKIQCCKIHSQVIRK